MTTFADVGATISQMFWGSQIGTYGFIGSARGRGPRWSAELKGMSWESDFAAPAFVDLDDLDFISVAVVDEIDGSGSAELVTSISKINSTTKARLLDALRSPMELWLYRNGVHVFSGPVVAGRIENGTLGLTATGLLTYLAWMGLSTSYVRSSEDQVTAVKELVDAYQALEQGNWGLDTTALVPSGVTRRFALLSTQAQTLDRVVADIAPTENGFDLYADPDTRQLRALSPYRGSDLSASVIVDDRQVTTTSWSFSVAPGQVATDIIGTAQAPGGGPVITAAGNAALRALAGRRTMILSFQNVTSRATLDSYARQAVLDYGSQVVTVSAGLVPVDLGYGQVQAGDTITVDQDFGLGPTSSARRVRRLAASVTSGGERIAVDFV